jgi:hypothetical protein
VLALINRRAENAEHSFIEECVDHALVLDHHARDAAEIGVEQLDDGFGRGVVGEVGKALDVKQCE